MGQKHSSGEEPRSLISVRDDARDFKATKTKRVLKVMDKKTLKKTLLNKRSNLAEETAEKQNRPESGDLAIGSEKDEALASGTSSASSVQHSPRFHVDNLILSGNPNIAELSHLTDLKMLRNFEDLSRTNVSADLLMAGKSMEDSEEKDFRTISYEKVPLIQLVGGRAAQRDSCTLTIDTRDSSHSESMASFSEENDTCKKDWSPEKTYVALRERLSRLECERDEAKLKLGLSEARCQAYETESRSLELSLDGLEERLRGVMVEVSDALSRSKELEQQILSSLEIGRPDELAVSSSS